MAIERAVRWEPERFTARAPGVREYLEAQRQALRPMLDDPRTCGVLYARRHAAAMDDLLRGLVSAVLKAQPASVPRSVTVLAVGGYGRGLLGYKSDLDIHFVTTRSIEVVQPLVEAILHPLWDAGVCIGHQVTNATQVLKDAEEDLPTATALLDARPLAGDLTPGQNLIQRAFEVLFSIERLPAFLARLDSTTRARHARFADSAFVLEPDVKHGIGGLRDLDVAMWAVRARFRVSTLQELERIGVILTHEQKAIESAQNFLWRARNCLHRTAGRRSDRLTFDQQAGIALAFGYGKEHEHADDRLRAAVEAFMSDYQCHTRRIARIREQLMVRATPRQSFSPSPIQELDRGLTAYDGELALLDPPRLVAEPSLALRLYSTAVKRGMPVAPDTRDCVARAAAEPEFGDRLRAAPQSAALFVDLVRSTTRTRFQDGSVLAELHDVGLLTAMIPELLPLVGRVQHDIYHVHPVDMHSVATLDLLRSLARGDAAPPYPLARRAMADSNNRDALLFAGLLHDIGKQLGQAHHEERGAELACTILTRLRLAEADVERACWLIRHHLALYRVATRRDLTDQETVARFARGVGTEQALRDLYLLTVADIATTGPQSMTSWKAQLIDELFVASEALLSGKDATAGEASGATPVEEPSNLSGAVDRTFLDELLTTMPARYLRAHGLDQIRAHAELAYSHRDQAVGVRMIPSRRADLVELCVVGRDEPDGVQRPGFLESIAAALAANRLEVCAAEVYSRPCGGGGTQAIDLFWVRHQVDGVAGVERVLPRLERDLAAVVGGDVSPEALLPSRRSRWAEREALPLRARVRIDDTACERHTVLEVSTTDRPGLLYTLAHALHATGLDVALAKITTEGMRAIDVFYVTERDGTKLMSSARKDEVQSQLLGALARFEDAQRPSGPSSASEDRVRVAVDQHERHVHAPQR